MKKFSSPRDSLMLEQFDYPLPKEKVALYPGADRAAAKMLVLDRKTDSIQHKIFRDLPEFLKSGDVLVLNNTRVIPARIFGHRMTGSKVEILLLKPIESNEKAVVWQALVKPSGRIKKGEVFEAGQDDVWVQVKVLDNPHQDDGRRLLQFETSDFGAFLKKAGHMPLPPYIHRNDELSDREQYQTVFAEKEGSVAAPTAGLHFDTALLEEIRKKGVQIVEVTLDVGYGTFQLMTAERVAEHHMAMEAYEISAEVAQAINQAKVEGRRVIACGTTSVRALESSAWEDGKIQSGRVETDLFIYPPYPFKIVDALITNFHFPRSSLLVLVSAFLGYEKMMSAYKLALGSDYRFASYGDGMLIL